MQFAFENEYLNWSPQSSWSRSSCQSNYTRRKHGPVRVDPEQRQRTPTVPTSVRQPGSASTLAFAPRWRRPSEFSVILLWRLVWCTSYVAFSGSHLSDSL